MIRIFSWFVLLLLFVLQNVMAGDLIKPTPLTTTEAQLYVDFRAVSKDADEADKAGKFVDASNLYLKYVEIGKGLKRDDLVAWGYNNAGYELIKEYNSNRKSTSAKQTLESAKSYLEKALKIEKANPDCLEKAQKNMKAVEYQLSVIYKK
jgi:hypothetical protein